MSAMGLVLRSRATFIALFVLLLATYAYPVQGLGPNELSRYDFVRALVDDRTLTIDLYHENTIDKGLYNGHYYSDKAFGLAVSAVPVYMIVRAIDERRGTETRNDFGVIYFLVLATVALPAATLGVLLGLACRNLGYAQSSLPLAVAFGFGTLAFPFSTMFFAHQTAALLAFAAAYLLFSQRPRQGSRGGFLTSAAAGLLAGTSALFEYPAGIAGAMLCLYVLAFFRDRRHFLSYAAGVAPAALALAAYNYTAFGDPLSISYSFTAAANFPAMGRGLMGVSWPDATVAWQLLFAGKGLLVNSPILLLAPVGCWLMLRRKQTRPEAILCLVVFASFLAYNSGNFNPFGGATPGPRYLVPALPFLALPLAAVFAGPTLLRVIAAQLTTWSILVMSSATITQTLVAENEALPLLHVWAPAALRGPYAYNIGQWFFGWPGASSLIPFGLLVVFGLLLISVAPFVSSAQKAASARRLDRVALD